MPEPIAYLDGSYVPISEARLHVFDLGVSIGASITEMIRTFRHRPYRVREHLDRLMRSLRGVGKDSPLAVAELETIVAELAERNGPLIPESRDLGIVLFVTMGQNLTYLGAAGREQARRMTVCAHTFPLPFELWGPKLESGQHLVTPSVRHIPPESIDPKIKHRSRMHWYLADQQARLADPEAIALALDTQGRVTETSTANFFLVQAGTIHTPPPTTTLEGVSQQTLRELAAELSIPYEPRDLHAYDVSNADEAFTSSTPYCMLPVTKFNGRPLGDGRPGPIFGRLLDAWGRRVGVDLASQLTAGSS